MKVLGFRDDYAWFKSVSDCINFVASFQYVGFGFTFVILRCVELIMSLVIRIWGTIVNKSFVVLYMVIIRFIIGLIFA